MTPDWKSYELFVAEVQDSLNKASSSIENLNSVVETNKKLKDKNGIERQFDVYWKFQYGGHDYETIIECKDYTRDISVDKVDALIGKLKDLPNVRGIFATKSGYQSGAQAKAKANGITLLIVRPFKEADFIDDHGNPLIQRVIINMELTLPPVIESCSLMIEDELTKNKEISEQIELLKGSNFLNEEIIIEKPDGSRSSLYDFSFDEFNLNLPYGVSEQKISLPSSYFCISNSEYRIPIHGLQMKINNPEPIRDALTVEAQLKAFIHDLISGERKFV